MNAARTGPRLRELGSTPAGLEQDLVSNLYYRRGTTMESASLQDAYQTLALTVRDRLVDRRARTAAAHYEANPRFVYYLSAEYMLGRQLNQNMLYTGTEDMVRSVIKDLGLSLGWLQALDVEPGLGNGGLGRLAACLLDSLATLDIPAVGYGIRYEFGIFKQTFEHGAQVERPDDWTFYGNPWEFPAPDDRQLVGFYGHTGGRRRPDRRCAAAGCPARPCAASPATCWSPATARRRSTSSGCGMPAPAESRSTSARFAAGQYAEAVQDVVRSENISKVLYPDDSTERAASCG